jgi:amino acid adenylation domain-containing protein
LERTDLGVGDHFFQVGGHSLKAMQVCARLQERWGYNVHIADLIAHPTVRAFAAALEPGNISPGVPERISPEPQAVSAYPLSAAQERMWALQEIAGAADAYIISASFSFDDDLDIERLRSAWADVLGRHEGLRSVFHWSAGELRQTPLPLEKMTNTFRYGAASFPEPFDLANGPLLRLWVEPVGPGPSKGHIGHFAMHHILGDEQTLVILRRELRARYTRQNLLPVTHTYRAFVLWERSGREALEGARAFWREKWRRPLVPLEMPVEFTRPVRRSFEGTGTGAYKIPAADAARLVDICTASGTSLFAGLVSIVPLLLHRYTRQDDLALGMPVSLRDRPEWQGVAGLLLNTVMMRLSVKGEDTWQELLGAVNQEIGSVLAHAALPFDDISGGLPAQRPFEVMVVMHEEIEEDQGWPVREIASMGRGSKTDLTFHFFHSPNGDLRVGLQYSTDIYGPEGAEHVLRHWLNLLASATREPGRPLSTLDYTDPDERTRLLNDWQGTGPVVRDTPARLFKRIATAHGEQPAIADALGFRMSYAALDKAADSLAATLQFNWGIGPGSIVGIGYSRRASAVTALLAVLKTGAGYLPLDNTLPAERIAYMLEDAGCLLCLAEAGFKVPTGRWHVEHDLAPGNDMEPAVTEGSDISRAYVIYTSGTTGRPKGVSVTQHALVNYVAGFTRRYPLGPGNRAALVSSLAFDLGYTALWNALLTGASLYLTEDLPFWDPASVYRDLARERIDFLKLTPSQFGLLLEEDRRHRRLVGLSRVVLGGEPIRSDDLAEWLGAYPQHTVINHYGPTETTVGVLTETITAAGLAAFARNPVLGTPLGRHKVYVLDGGLQPSGIGVYGELYISGPGLSTGYLNSPGLTRDRFIRSPSEPDVLLYRTGDKGRWTVAGKIGFAGRLDEQVKVNGYRVEPSEVARALEEHPAVDRAAVVVVPGPQGAYLYAYIQQKEPDETRSWKEFLKTRLPYYMIPSGYTVLDRLPLTGSGKIDRRALPDPAAGRASVNAVPVEGRTAAERVLLEQLRLLLGRDDIGMTDDFLQWGGNSILAIRLSAKLGRSGWLLQPRDIFMHPVLERMAALMSVGTHLPPIAPLPPADDYAVSAAQRRMWFVDALEDSPVVYNAPGAYRIVGPLDPEAVQKATAHLVQRHEILRTIFPSKDGIPRQKIMPYDESRHGLILIMQTGAEDADLLRAEAHTRFDLAAGPLFRMVLVRLSDETHLFSLTVHHILSDGWTKQVLLRDFLTLYDYYAFGLGALPAPLPFQYKDFAAWQNALIGSDAMDGHRRFWQQTFSGQVPLLQLPLDYPRPLVKEYRSRQESIRLPGDTIQALEKFCLSEGVSRFHALLATWALLLSRYANQEDLVIGIPTAGRDAEWMQDQAGLYMNVLPFRVKVGGGETFSALARRVRDNTGEALEHAAYPIDALVDDLGIQRDTSRSALFDVLFVSEAFDDVFHGKARTFEMTPVQGDFSGNKFDLSAYVRPDNGALDLTIGYNALLFSATTIRRMLSHYVLLLANLLRQDRDPVGGHCLLTAPEWQSNVIDFNDTVRPYGRYDTLHGLFERQAAKTPGNTAIKEPDGSLSYAALERLANRIAWKLIHGGIRSGDNVGLVTGRNRWMIAGMLGILKAGAAYVPVDPRYPVDRQRYILHQANVATVVSDQVYPGMESVLLTAVAGEALREDAPGLSIDSGHLAYVIFTSGSSGRPKGVMIAHHSAVNLVEWVNTTFGVGPEDRILFVTSMCFDLSVYDIFGSLAAGAAIVIASQEDVQDIHTLTRLLVNERITFWDSVPTTLDFLVEELARTYPGLRQDSLRVAFMSGDWIPVGLPDKLTNFFPNVRPVSLGGATEGTVWSNFFPIDAVDPAWKSIPYGKPIQNNFFYILDPFGNPVPAGVAGELYIGGAGVSLGYIGDPVKTEAAFVKDPFLPQLGARMYRTGDLGRLLPDGNMEFLGRKDFQVKIRGFRVELGEIEHALERYPGVRGVVVQAFSGPQNGNAFLAAYYVAGDPIPREEFMDHAMQSLPDYMVPTVFVRLDAFPLNTNGKIDRKALPPPEAGGDAPAHVPPETPTEHLLDELWRELIGRDSISTKDNFFALGGHSLLAARLIARIQERTGKPVRLRDIFGYSNIQALGAYIDRLPDAGDTPLQQKAANKIVI